MKVAVTGAAGRIAYSLLFMIANGDMFGKLKTLSLRMYDLDFMVDKMEGIAMELRDCAYTLLDDLIVTSKPEEAFDDCDVIIMLGAYPRKPGMTRADVLEKNSGIFKTQGKQIADHAKKDVKVVVIGNPANTNAWIISKFIQKKYVSCLTRLDMNRAIGQLQKKTGLTHIKQVVVWGNHSASQYPDFRNAVTVRGDFIGGENEELISVVQNRGSEVLNKTGMSSAASAAKAVSDHIRDWYMGSNSIVTMGVVSDGSYGVPEGLVFSFPVRCTGQFEYKIIKNIIIDKSKLSKSIKELMLESTSIS